MLDRLYVHFYWLYQKKKFFHLFNIGSGVFIWLFLTITKPFGIYENNLSNSFELALYLSVFGIVWSLNTYLIHYLVSTIKQSRALLSSTYYLILILVVQIHAFFGLKYVACQACSSTSEYLELWIACSILLGLFYIPFAFYGRYLYFHSLLTMPDHSNLIQLQIECQEVFQLNPSQAILFQSDDNYVDVLLLQSDSSIKKQTIRATLKSIEIQFKDYPNFIRVHRSSIINTQFYKPNSFNKKELTLASKNFTKTVPVSKTYHKSLQELFIHPEN